MSVDSHSYGPTGDWLVGTVKRNPEAFLVLAAGCALMMRGASRGGSVSPPRDNYADAARQSRGDNGHSWGDGVSRLADSASRATENAKEYATDVKDRVSETANSYASSLSSYAEDAGRTIADRTSHFTTSAQSTIEQGAAKVLREQPLAVAVFGLAAGAALAAIFPSTDAEGQALGPARDALYDAANKAGASLKEAAGEAGTRLKEAASERGLSAEGLKDMAREAAGAFSDKVEGAFDSQRSPGSQRANGPQTAQNWQGGQSAQGGTGSQSGTPSGGLR
jgi:hypothetical protein